MIWDFCLTLERWHLSHVHGSLTSSCPPPFMCYHKIICFWQTSRWVTYAWLSSPGGGGEGSPVLCGDRPVLVQRPTHTKKRPLQSFPWFLFWAASMVSTVSQAPPKKWHILRPDASDSQYRAVIISRALFFCPRKGGRLYLTNDEFKYPSTPWAHQRRLPDIAGFQPRQRGVWKASLPFREARQHCVITGNATFTFSHCA